MGKFRQCLTELSASDSIMAGYYSLTFLFFQVITENAFVCLSIVSYAIAYVLYYILMDFNAYCNFLKEIYSILFNSIPI